MTKKIDIICHVDNPSPALSQALNEMVRLAAIQCGISEPNFEIVEKPPYNGSGAEHDPANYGADNQ